MDTSAAAVCRRYFSAWTSRDRDAVRECLADDFTFTTGGMTITGREQFLAQGGFPASATTTLLGEAFDQDRGFQFYEAVNGPARVRIAEMHTVADGRIQSSLVVTDTAEYLRFLAGEPAPERAPWQG